MKRLLILIALCITCCNEPPGDDTVYRYDVERCDGSRFTAEVTPQLAPIQEQSNVITREQDTLYIVESGTNVVSTYDTQTDTYAKNFIDVGNDRNPYDIFLMPDDNQAVITNYFAATVTVADLTTGEVIAEFGSDYFISPSGVAASDTHLYVSDVEFGRGENGFGSGAIHIFEKNSWAWVGKITPQRQNPHYISVAPSRDTLVIVNVGAVGFTEGRYRQIGEGAIEAWTLTDDPLKPDVAFATIQPGEMFGMDGAPARPMFSGDSMYFVSATSPIMTRLNLVSMAWEKPPDDPFVLYTTAQDTLHAADRTPDGLAVILSYNQDAFYLFDTTCDRLLAGPLNLGTAPDDLEGPLDVVTHGNDRAYFITSLSKQLGRIRFLPQPL